MSDSAPRPTADEDWDNLLHQWRTQQTAQPQPFFYSRVRARLVEQEFKGPQPFPVWLRWPSYAVMLAIILMLSGDGAVERSIEPANHYQVYPDGR
ncbi:hypothetical protein HMJ29_11360 [Hymenobacter taeanensis]|uniref:Uncharacterized protein n=1 Tax=Hymenobacter taeanensis TaxID=2735321 RepID=A0A6M6BI74_9BACT|nr:MULTISPECIES: hypothetical protein [Hymenobacter]QJX47504.1 hypothetical protein HMJ29_11360 [Hymenobacter taeanensis]UOQ83013.1 hypothetical protein MUN83_09745 [Hymenobacter sp. 5414T-23]